MLLFVESMRREIALLSEQGCQKVGNHLFRFSSLNIDSSPTYLFLGGTSIFKSAGRREKSSS